jgi:hypothetical protein
MNRNDSCLLVHYILHAIDLVPEPVLTESSLDAISAEDLARELIDFIETGNADDYSPHGCMKQFLADAYHINYEDYIEHPTIERTEIIIGNYIMREFEYRVKKEQEELSTYTEMCVQWAKERGLNRMTKSDMNAFLANNYLILLQETMDSLWSRVNFELKTKE